MRDKLNSVQQAIRSLFVAVGGGAFALLIGAAAQAKCDYRISGDIKVERNGAVVPLRGVDIRVKRKGGTGAGRAVVRTDEKGQFNGTWSFTKGADLVIQTKLRNDDLKIERGGWGETPWDVVGRSRLTRVWPHDEKYRAHASQK